ncbi:MAG: methyl-accepting chemotaxis protein [Oscillospiraceae bacterium]|nr:methyl-accepting chemotaxis protein [Oscillospiraceae bacterium]
MKNLKVKQKILMSFSIIILLIVALSVFVITSNMTINNNVRFMLAETQLQAHGTKLIDHFSQANAGVNSIYSSFDENVYSSIMANIAGCVQTVEKMQAIVDTNPDLQFLLPHIGAVGASGAAWSANIEGIIGINRELEAAIVSANTNQRAITDLSMEIFESQIELSRGEATQDIDEEAKLRRVQRIEQGVDIGFRLNQVGSSFNVMFKSLDTSNVSQDRAFFYDTVGMLTQFHDDSSIQQNIDTSSKMLDTLELYNDDIDSFLSGLSRRADLIRAGSTLNTNALNAVDVLVGAIETSSIDSANQTIGTTSLIQIIAISIVLVVIATSVLLALIMSSQISNPLALLTNFMQVASETGDVMLSQQDYENITEFTKANDDIGQCIASCSAFVSRIIEVAKVLEIIAGNDLTAELAPLSDHDTIGISLQHMVENLNTMFNNINSATTQVSAGSRQVADGAQSLAQGSTQQAASIEELLGSITDIAQKTKTNASTAERAAKLADTIKSNAEKGSHQMDEMISAVKSIDQSSQNIGKVIKVIDDIAFQTNILALNAAVEAARAGQHGKGFAVVAEEVRNLASKSAEAAKDTGSMIQASVEKAELGVRIAEETATSLSEIVIGVNDSSQMIREIARASEEQSIGTTQINNGIDQVAQVVQMNSATAQESAAASEEMSSQSNVLQELISQFKLRDNFANRRLIDMT